MLCNHPLDGVLRHFLHPSRELGPQEAAPPQPPLPSADTAASAFIWILGICSASIKVSEFLTRPEPVCLPPQRSVKIHGLTVIKDLIFFFKAKTSKWDDSSETVAFWC